ncbi:MAG: hypothetical protein AAF197_08695 [Pseudomonadota bacterium]
MIESAKYIDDNGGINISIDGGDMFLPAANVGHYRTLLEEWIADGNTVEEYVPPEPVSPTQIPLNKVQFKATLGILDVTDDQVLDIIDQMIADLKERAIAKAKFQHSDVYHRENPLFDLIGSSMSISPEQIDDAWSEAVDIQ